MTKRPRLVLDTNVVVSALLWEGRPGQLLARAESSGVRLCTSRILLDELRDTLERPKLAKRVHLTGLSVAEMVVSYRRVTTIKRPVLLDQPFSRDPDDDHVIACAIAAGADAIVSGDQDLLSMKTVSGIAIRTVADAFEWLDALGMKTIPER